METLKGLFESARRRQREGDIAEARRLYAEALAVLQRAVEREPDRLDLVLVQARALKDLGQLVAAQEVLARAAARFPDQAEVLEALGDVRMTLEDFAGAADAYQGAIARQSQRQSAREGLVQALMRLDRHPPALAALETGLEGRPDDPRLLHLQGNALLASGDVEAAALVFERLHRIVPADPGPLFNLGICRIKQHRNDAARAIFADLESRSERVADARYYQALAALSAGNIAAALAGFEAVLATEPLHINSLWYRGHCLRELGRHEDARPLLDPEVLVVCLDPLNGLAEREREKLLGDLADYVRRYPYQHWEPGGKTTRGGFQTASLLKRGDPLMDGMERLVRSRLTNYLDRLALSPEHPLKAHRPARFGVEMWATILRSGGHQKAHIHPGGWISGVFYCALPAELPGQAGWIEFGMPPYETATSYPPLSRRIRPKPGLMVLFPSWLPHATVPFEAEQPRISLAFDIMPIVQGPGIEPIASEAG